MTTHDQQTDGWGDHPQQFRAEHAVQEHNRVAEETFTPTQSDATTRSGDGPSTAPMDPRDDDAGQRTDAGHAQRFDDREHASRIDHETGADGGLFAHDELAGLRARWDAVQAGFVDDPRDCVQKADGLVADLVQQLISGFGQARSRLEEQWGRGEQASTEDLRVALKRYRSFFERLLTV